MALDLFSQHSYDDVSIDYIAGAASVSKGLLYHYFGGAEVAAIIARTRETFADQVLDGTGVDPSRPQFRFAAPTYVGAVEAASLAWLRDPSVGREAVVHTLLAILHANMTVAATLDPDAGFEPDPTQLAALGG